MPQLKKPYNQENTSDAVDATVAGLGTVESTVVKSGELRSGAVKSPAANENPALLQSTESYASSLYIALRTKENRIVSDIELRQLPQVHTAHIHFKEWQVRGRSVKKLLKYIRQKQMPLRILEVGCGNGWFSNHMSSVEKTDVTGLDINTAELKQARRVFGYRANLRFVTGDLREAVVSDHKYDLIVFAASIQYFRSLPDIITTAQQHLKENGEIYITDSMFYDQNEIPLAKSRSAAYFKELDFSGMTDFYFHHAITDLDFVQHKVLYKPGTIVNKLLGKNDPFYRILIKAKNR